MNYKTRHNMADRTRARSTEDQAGMAALLAKVKEKRQQAAGVNDSFTLPVEQEISANLSERL